LNRIRSQKNDIAIRLATVAVAVLAVFMCIVSITLAATADNEDEQQVSVAVSDEKTKYNFLIMGVDKSERLADVIMLVSLDTENNSLAVAQLPRDTYAEYTASAYRKLNGAISVLGGGRAVSDFLEDSLGIKIDHYVTVNLDGIAKAVDILGGVEVNIPYDMIYEDPYQGLEIELKAGKTLLDGEKSKQFIRYRAEYVRGDIARLDAQKLFLAALVEKLKSKGAVSLLRPVSTLISESESDLAISDCMFFASSVANIELSNISFMTFPGSDVKTDNGTWYYIINKKQTRAMLEKYFYTKDVARDTVLDTKKVFTGEYSKKFNTVYFAESGYDTVVYTADAINKSGIDIERTNE